MQQLRWFEEGRLAYLDVDARQRAIHAQVAAGQAPDSILFSEFDPVYTLGSRTNPQDVPDPSVPTVRTDRGGSVTYHGPGQLVAYPIIRVHGRQDVVAYVRALEAAAMATAAEYGIDTTRVPGRTGVWVVRPGEADRKLCAIGVRFAKHTTMHGLALNVTTDLADFDRIVPCGIRDAGVVSLAALGVTANMSEVADVLYRELCTHLARFRSPAAVQAESNTQEVMAA